MHELDPADEAELAGHDMQVLLLELYVPAVHIVQRESDWYPYPGYGHGVNAMPENPSNCAKVTLLLSNGPQPDPPP